MTFPTRRLSAALVLVATIALVTACAPDTDPDTAPTGDAGGTPSAPAPAASPSESETAAADPACDTIIPASTVSDFESVGWTFEENPFYIGGLEITDGIMCRWADFDAPAGDNLQLFGWAPITETEAAQAQSALVDQGWIREESAAGLYITENPETTIAVDDEGYGMTYLFVEGSVALADTKQGLFLVEWPRS